MSREWQQNSMLNPTNIVLNDIAEERRHQIVKGYDAAHDDAHVRMELTDAGIAFAQGAILLDQKRRVPEIRISTTPGAEHWPFEPQTYKPSDSPRQNLVRSCAMLVAEIERLDRQAEEKQDSLKPETDSMSLDESLDRNLEQLRQVVERQESMLERLVKILAAVAMARIREAELHDPIGRQRELAAWALDAFGEAEATSTPHRAIRLGEEAAETLQAAGVPREKAHFVVDYVYDKPVGNLAQEIGGLRITTALLAQTIGMKAEEAEQYEWERIQKKVAEKGLAYFAKRNRIKNEAGLPMMDYCEYCGPYCLMGAEHNARREDNVKWGTIQGDIPETGGN